MKLRKIFLSADFIWICEKHRYEADKCQLCEVYDIVNKKEDGAWCLNTRDG